MKIKKALVAILAIFFAICVPLLGFLLGMTSKTPLEVQSYEVVYPTQASIYCNCIVDFDCCCPTETATPTETVVPFSTPTEQVTTTKRVETVIPSATSTTIPKLTATIPAPTITDAPPTETPFIPTDTPLPTATRIPSATVKPCIWLCHQTGNAGEKDYCCDSQECVNGHLEHHEGDYLGKCK